MCYLTFRVVSPPRPLLVVAALRRAHWLNKRLSLPVYKISYYMLMAALMGRSQATKEGATAVAGILFMYAWGLWLAVWLSEDSS